MNQVRLAARIRKTRGKGAARRTRKNHQVPAIFYGPKSPSLMLTVEYTELVRVLKEAQSETPVLALSIESEQGPMDRHVMLKDLTVDPVKRTFVHADFYEISMDEEITIRVPIHVINTPAGVKNGGILEHVRRDISISCLPDRLVKALEVDVSGLEIGDSIHIGDIPFPEGIRPDEDTALTVAVVQAPAVTQQEAEQEEDEEGKA